MNKLKLSGFLYFFAGAIVLMSIITAEALYPPLVYSTFKNEISDLGATRQPNSLNFEPSSTIFITIILLAGIWVLIASFY